MERIKVYGNSYSSAIAWFLYTSVDLEVSGRENENASHLTRLDASFVDMHSCNKLGARNGRTAIKELKEGLQQFS